MRYRIVQRLVVLLALLTFFIPSYASADVTPKQVDDALKKSKEWIYAQQKDGNWEKVPARDASVKSHADVAGAQWGGLTALCTYALLAAGESPQDERLAKSIEFLKKAEMIGVYAVAMRAQVWLHLPSTGEVKGLMYKDAQALRAMARQQGEARGMYDYTAAGRGYNHSSANYGVLGMWAAEQAGAEVPTDFWKMVEEGWVKHQDASGGWAYRLKPDEKHPVTPGMTAAGLATLFITQDYVHPGRGLDCYAGPPMAAMEKGLKWLADTLPAQMADAKFPHQYATLYGLERVGVASGLRYFGTVDWYQGGATWLLKKQKKDGSWGDLDDTCLATLFLSRGRAPVMMSKLQYGAPDAKPIWNVRARDAANVVRWFGKAAERELNWQIVNLSAPLNDLHDAPVLYVSGSKEFALDEEQRKKLKEYVEGGGMVLANADCGGKPFVESVTKLAKEVFPAYAFRELPADHVIYTNQQFARERWKTKPSVLGLSNGVRELVLLIPQADASKAWQMGTVGGKEELWQLGANIMLYAVDKRNLRNKGETHLVARNEKKKPTKTLTVARLEYAGNWNPEPGGWPRLGNVLHNDHNTTLNVTTVKLGAGALGGDVKVAHLTGTAEFEPDATALAEIQKFIESGGTLVIDAAGGSSAFAVAIEAFLEKLAPKGLKPLTANHPIYKGKDGPKLDVNYREHAKRALGASRDPRLRGIEKDGRLAVVYSREDLSAGLVGQAVDGIVGYDPASATALMARIVLHAGAGNGATPKSVAKSEE